MSRIIRGTAIRVTRLDATGQPVGEPMTLSDGVSISVLGPLDEYRYLSNAEFINALDRDLMWAEITEETSDDQQG